VAEFSYLFIEVFYFFVFFEQIRKHDVKAFQVAPKINFSLRKVIKLLCFVNIQFPIYSFLLLALQKERMLKKSEKKIEGNSRKVHEKTETELHRNFSVYIFVYLCLDLATRLLVYVWRRGKGTANSYFRILN